MAAKFSRLRRFIIQFLIFKASLQVTCKASNTTCSRIVMVIMMVLLMQGILCPSNTASGTTVDQNGCSDDQKDADCDGVPDYLDYCLNTPLGTEVNSNGCAVNPD